MNGKERGFLLLTSQLGDPERKPLTVAQFRTLARRVSLMERPKHSGDITEEDLIGLGYDRRTAFRILQLLADEGCLERYLCRGKMKKCFPVSRAGEAYPAAVRKRLGTDAPGCLWLKGDASLLQTPMISLVGSRDLSGANLRFAQTVGAEAARQGITLVSGNARGADTAAQEACLQNGGKVISVVADELERHSLGENILYISEDSFDLPFTSQRALSRNRVIHGLGYMTFVAQCTLGRGGTWDGTVKNLQNNWSPVFCYADGSAAAGELEQLGATLIGGQQLSDFAALQSNIQSFL